MLSSELRAAKQKLEDDHRREVASLDAAIAVIEKQEGLPRTETPVQPPAPVAAAGGIKEEATAKPVPQPAPKKRAKAGTIREVTIREIRKIDGVFTIPQVMRQAHKHGHPGKDVSFSGVVKQLTEEGLVRQITPRHGRDAGTYQWIEPPQPVAGAV